MSFLSSHFVQTVSPNLPLVQARIVIIFGNKNKLLVREMAHYAGQLYQKGFVEKIIVTGGVRLGGNERLQDTEAEYARKIILGYGISGKNIVFENRSTNTFENVVNARRLLLKAEGKLLNEPIICLGMHHPTRRFLMTMAKNWPQAIPTFVGFDSFSKPKSQWHLCGQISDLLKTDYNKWSEYEQKNHIKPIDTQKLSRKLKATGRPLKLTKRIVQPSIS